MSDDRIALYDNMRAALIVSVVVGHVVDMFIGSGAYQSLFLFLYTFHMPAFLFLSGLFYDERTAMRKALGDVFIGFVLKIILCLPALLHGRPVSFSLLSDGGLPWYMFVLAAYLAVSQLLRDVDRRFLLVFSVALGCFVGYDSAAGDWLYLSRAVVFFPFFLLGQMCDRERLASISHRPALRLTGAVLLLAWAAICLFCRRYVYFLRPLFTGRNPFTSSAMFVQVGCLWRLGCYAISSVVGAALLCLTPDKPMPYITACGQKTLQIFFWHLPILWELNQLTGLLTHLASTRLGKLLLILLAAASAFLLSARIFAFPTSHILSYVRRRRGSTSTQTEKDASLL